MLENHDPEVLPLPTEQYPVTGGPRTLLRRRQAKQLLAMTERILEVRATTSGSDIIVASFTDSSFDLTEVAGRHGIEIADQASCAAGWDPLSSSGRQRFWHVHCTSAPKLVIYRCSAMALRFQPFEGGAASAFQVSSGSTAIACERYALATHTGTSLSSGRLHAPGIMDTGDTTSFAGWTAGAVGKHTAGNETVNVVRGGMSSNASRVMSCLRPLTQRASHTTDVVRSPAKPLELWTAVMRGLFAQH